MIHKKICVILHLYYVDLWEYFLPYLRNINTDIDLYVTITDNHSGNYTDISDKIFKEYPDAFIYSLPNRGMDIAPFIYVMNEINQSGKIYNSLIKLHSKKSIAHSIELGERWRNELTNALLCSTERLTECFIACTQTTEVMVAHKNWVLKEKTKGYEQDFFSDKLPYEYEFVGGTMFMVNFKVIMDWFSEELIYEKYYNNFEDGYFGDGSLAHIFERVLGCLIKTKGYLIKGV